MELALKYRAVGGPAAPQSLVYLLSVVPAVKKRARYKTNKETRNEQDHQCSHHDRHAGADGGRPGRREEPEDRFFHRRPARGWTRDRDFFIAAAEKQGAKVFVQSADASEQRQISQIENLIRAAWTCW
jgi:hypothetical protein